MFLRNTVILLAMLPRFVLQPSSAQNNPAISGDVTKVDLTSGMITILHEPNQQLRLGRSTDTFRVSDPIMLNAIWPGAHIRFAAARINGELAIIKIFTD
jgi:Cu/Ag efflux protein CusF